MVISEAWNDNGLDDVRVVGIKNDFFICGINLGSCDVYTLYHIDSWKSTNY